METTTAKEQWSIIIDTDSFAGNFEHELAAYCTGESTPRGDKFAQKFLETHGVSPKEINFFWR